MNCIECGEKSKEGYWNERDWARLTIRVELGPQHYERSGYACPKCLKQWQNKMRARPAPEEEA
jgi:hypothetical protein